MRKLPQGVATESLLSQGKAEESGEKLQDLWKCILLKVVLWFILGLRQRRRAEERVRSGDGRVATSFLRLSPRRYTALLSKCKLTQRFKAFGKDSRPKVIFSGWFIGWPVFAHISSVYQLREFMKF